MEPARIAWLPQFVHHYRDLGVERFLLTLQLEPDARLAAKDTEFARFRETLAGLGIREAWRWEHSFGAPALVRFQDELVTEYLKPDDWIVWCDSDEFQVYPAHLAEMTAQCAALKVTFVRGVFIDRVAADYSLPAFDGHTPIGDTFPRMCNVTTTVVAGDPRKVVLTRGDVKVIGGKHYVRDHSNPKTIAGWVQVHHFKWDAMVLERLRYRVRPEWRAKFPWWVESQRILDYFAINDMRFNPADLRPIVVNGSNLLAFE
jgi:hypothetical protein